MTVSHLERQGNRYYFRGRIPGTIARFVGRTHIILSLRTSEFQTAKILSAGLFFSLARVYVEMRAKMALLLDIQPEELNDPQRLLRRQFELGQQFQAAQQRLVAEFDAAHAQLGKLIQLSILRQPDAQIALGMSLGTTVPLRQIPIVTCPPISLH